MEKKTSPLASVYFILFVTCYMYNWPYDKKYHILTLEDISAWHMYVSFQLQLFVIIVI